MHEELVSLLPDAEFDRRRFVVTSLAAGFALAMQPVAAQTVITTSAEGLVAGEVKIPVADGEIPAYRAMPEKGKNFPVALVVQEIFGVHEHIKDVCRRFAKLGHMAIAPALYARQGDTSQIADMTKVMEVVAKVPDAQVMADLDATVAYAAKTGQADAKRLGITGFCWGGRVVWLYAAHNPQLDAGVAWYGRLVARAGQPANPLHAEAARGRGRRPEGARARTLRRQGSRHPARHGRADARGAQELEVEGRALLRDRRLPGGRPRLPRRLPPDLQQRGRDRRLAKTARVVQAARRGMNIELAAIGC